LKNLKILSQGLRKLPKSSAKSLIIEGGDILKDDSYYENIIEEEREVNINGIKASLFYENWGWHVWVKGMGEIGFALDDEQAVANAREKLTLNQRKNNNYEKHRNIL
jgi:hypothetical protein